MYSDVTMQLLSTLGGITFVFGGLLWKDLNDKVRILQQEQNSCPFPNMKVDIALIKQDIQWIKQNLK